MRTKTVFVYFECYFTAGKHDRLSMIYFHSNTTLPVNALSSQIADFPTSRFFERLSHENERGADESSVK